MWIDNITQVVSWFGSLHVLTSKTASSGGIGDLTRRNLTLQITHFEKPGFLKPCQDHGTEIKQL